MENLQTVYYTALKKRYESQIAEAEANLTLYFSSKNLAAIGEHSDLLTEHDRWIEQLANAKDKLETLENFISTGLTING
jgi:hypothetical protein